MKWRNTTTHRALIAWPIIRKINAPIAVESANAHAVKYENAAWIGSRTNPITSPIVPSAARIEAPMKSARRLMAVFPRCHRAARPVASSRAVHENSSVRTKAVTAQRSSIAYNVT